MSSKFNGPKSLDELNRQFRTEYFNSATPEEEAEAPPPDSPAGEIEENALAGLVSELNVYVDRLESKISEISDKLQAHAGAAVNPGEFDLSVTGEFDMSANDTPEDGTASVQNSRYIDVSEVLPSAGKGQDESIFEQDETGNDSFSPRIIQFPGGDESQKKRGRELSGEEEPRRKKRTKGQAWRSVSDTLFFFAIAFIIMGALMYSMGSSTGSNFLGWSYYEVVSPSMQDEIPQGSLVLVKHVDASTIKVGDTITYLRSDGNSVTHKVIRIIEDYEEGARGFETQGTMNELPDPDIVNAVNVLGVVKWHAAGLGDTMSYIGDHWYFVAIFFIVLVLTATVFKMYFSERKKHNEAKDQKPKSKDGKKDGFRVA